MSDWCQDWCQAWYSGILFHKYPNTKPDTNLVFEKSLRLADYYVAHARKTYTSIESRELTNAKKILKMIHSRKLESRFKASDIYRKCSTTLKDTAVTEAALKYLEEKRIVAQEKQIGGVGRHSTEWVIHPTLQKR